MDSAPVSRKIGRASSFRPPKRCVQVAWGLEKSLTQLKLPWRVQWNSKPSSFFQSVYHWVRTFTGGPDDRLYIWTPIQAAVAGACTDNLRLLVDAGAKLDELINWLMPLGFCVPRVKAALAVCDYVIKTCQGNEAKSFCGAWLESIRHWLTRQIAKTKRDRTEKETLLDLYRRLVRIYGLVGGQANCPNRILADLL